MKDKEKAKYNKLKIREKYKTCGLSGMTEHEILSLLLSYTSVDDIDAAASEILNDFGNIYAVFNSDISYFISGTSVDKSGAVLLSIIPELSRKYILYADKISFLDSDNQIKKYFINQYKGINEERLCIVYVDEKKYIKNIYTQFSGFSDSVNVDIRKIAEHAILNNAYGMFISHNHPFSSSTPSESDYASTLEIISAMKFYDIKVFDHIIVGISSVTSMKSEGIINKFDE